MKVVIACATALETGPLRRHLDGLEGIEVVVTGVGLLETGVVLGRRLVAGSRPDLLFCLGVGGGFSRAGVEVLDICIAGSEIIADFGIPDGERVIPFSDSGINPPFDFVADQAGVAGMRKLFQDHGIGCHCGPFLSVNAVTATEARMDALWRQYRPVCENMEGAAVARVAAEFDLPWLEVRCVSNPVGRRDRGNWKLAAAASRLAEVMGPVIKGLLSCKLS